MQIDKEWEGAGWDAEKQKPVPSDQSVEAEHHTYELKEIPTNWEWTDWLLGKRKGIGCFQCKMENKRSVELVIKALYFKGLHKVSYLLRHKSPAGQKCPFLNLPLNELSQQVQGLIGCVLGDITNVTAREMLQ